MRQSGYILITVMILVALMSAMVEQLSREVSMEYNIISNLRQAFEKDNNLPITAK